MSEIQTLEIPKVNVIELLNIANKYLNHEIDKEEILEKYGPEYLTPILEYAKAYGKDIIENKIHNFLNSLNDETIRTLNDEGFSKQLTDTAIAASSLVMQYFKSDIDVNTLFAQLGNVGGKEIVNTLISAYEIDPNLLKEAAEKISSQSSIIVSYAAFAEAYKILMSALNDAAMQHEHRLMVEKQCAETVALIKEYREKMQETITAYFEKHLQTFENGFAQMDIAIMKNDSNGYLKGNAEIQEMLGYYAQFRTQEEFDDLMEYDVSCKL